ncbi:Uncharacterized protein Rs2_35635 [Raphanus sativus]|nr:Uncharacterized protein Rs2_35635 [Raphanus sativus]
MNRELWRAKEQPLRIRDQSRQSLLISSGKSVTTNQAGEKGEGSRSGSLVHEQDNERDDSNVTYRAPMLVQKADLVGVDELIPPYDALKIDALQDDNHEDADADMHDEPVGNELMAMEEDDLLGDELNRMEKHDFEEESNQPSPALNQSGSILMIEPKEKSVEKDKGDDQAKTRIYKTCITKNQ